MDRIPLFPMDSVTYPDEFVSLQVTDERHALMIEQALAMDAPFGVILATPSVDANAWDRPVADVGTLVRVLACVTSEDGRRDVVLTGTRRFRVHRIVNGGTFPVADVEWLGEPSGPVTDAAIAERNVRDDLEFLGMADVIPEDVDPVRTSYAVAAALHASHDLKQKLLAADTAYARLQLAHVVLTTLVDVDDAPGAAPY